MGTDFALQRDVLAVLRNHLNSTAADIAVAVRKGVVSLSGEVDSLQKRTTAAQLAESVPGVQSVANDIVVRFTGDRRRTDLEIAHDAVNALINDTDVPDKTIKVRVQDRWIWLVGEAETEHQRRAAELAVSTIPGIEGVSNVVRLKPLRAGNLRG